MNQTVSSKSLVTRVAGRALGLLLAVLLAAPGLLAGSTPKSALATTRFTLVEDTPLVDSGVTEKYLLQDDRGQTWLFKPMTEAEAYTEEAAWRLATLFGLETPEAFSVRTAKGIHASLIRVIEVRGNLSKTPPTGLDSRQLGQLLEIEVFRWLIGDFDSHCRNFLQSTAGDILTIDHGRAFRSQDFFRYRLDRGPAHDPISYFEDLWAAYAQGRVELALEETFPFIDRVMAVPERDIAAILAPLARLRERSLGHVLKDHYGEVIYHDAEEFLFGVEHRRRRLRKDFTRFYARMSRERLPGGFEPPPPVGTRVAPGRGEEVDSAPATLEIVDPRRRLVPLRRVGRRWKAFTNVLKDSGVPKILRRIGQRTAEQVDRLGHGLGKITYRGLTTRHVADLDLSRLPGGKSFLDRLRRTRPEIVRLLRERVAFLTRSAEGPVETANATRLAGWIDHYFPPDASDASAGAPPPSP